MLQLLNPKAWMMALSAISGFTLAGEAYWPSAGWVLGIITTVYLALLVFLFLLGIGALVAFRSS